MSCKLLFHVAIEAVVVNGPSHVESMFHLHSHLVLLQLLFLGPRSQQERQVVGCYRGMFRGFDV
eukprot:5074097-Prorocentrum_lima.AAC.1